MKYKENLAYVNELQDIVFIFTYSSQANIYEDKQMKMSFTISVKQNISFGMKTAKWADKYTYS